jgi:hypothetical protein
LDRADRNAPRHGDRKQHPDEHTDGGADGNNTAPCDDSDPCTLNDTCDGNGNCTGQNLAGTYAVLRGPTVPTADVDVQIGTSAQVNDNVCADVIRLGRGAEVCGDAVSPKTRGTAVSVGWAAMVNGNVVHASVNGTVVTGGGSVLRPDRCYKAPLCGRASEHVAPVLASS